jgi:putative flippase GtrA
MKLPQLTTQAARYFVTGGIAAVVDVTGFHLLAQHMPGVLAPAVASFLLAAVVNYTLTSAWVFGSDWRSLRRAAMFLAFATVGLAINAGVTWSVATLLGVPPTLAKIVGIGVAFSANFLMNALIVFRDRGCEAAAPRSREMPPRTAPANAPR